ncbi:hypothetical protein MMC11_000318 [Xylographa trunciseda]|nr:hypothetical protein [Xylographa trunciseda]
MHQTVLGFLALCALPGIRCLTGPQIAIHFEKTLSPASRVHLPTDPNYSNETIQRWNIFNPPTYIVSVQPALDTDVQEVISYSHANSIPFLGTGGGHGYSTTLSALQNGIEMDLGLFNTSSIDTVANTMTVGGSVIFSDVFSALQEAGKELREGALSSSATWVYLHRQAATGCSCVGIVGATLGGGIGYYSGLHGLISDSLHSVRMVTGTGELLTASATSNADLFWGIKGAGFNYGVVTEATYRVYNHTNGGEAMSADMMFPATFNGSIWETVKGFVGKQPKALSLNVAIGFEPTIGLRIIVNALYVGPLDAGKALIKPFLDLQPMNLNISTLSYAEISDNAIYGLVARGCIRGVNYTSFGINLYDVDVATLVEVVNYMNTSMSANPVLGISEFTSAQFAPYGFELYADDTSAYPYRNTVVYSRIDGSFLSAADAPVVETFASNLRKLLQTTAGAPNGALQVYVHYAKGDEGPEAWYTAEKLPRLQQLKAKHDPAELFGFYNAVP